MLNVIIRRSLFAIPTLIIVSVAIFLLIELIPGDAAEWIAGDEATPERVEYVRSTLGLDRPIWERYGSWASGAVQLDLGESLGDGRPITESIKNRFPVTLQLAIGGTIVGIALGVPVGVLAGLRPGTRADRISRTAVSTVNAMPSFWLAPLLIIAFAINRRWLPSSGWVPFRESPIEYFKHMALPCLTLGLLLATALARQVRGSVHDVMTSSFIRTIWAKGGTPTRVVMGHALRNAAIPPVTVLALQFSALLGGTVIIERVFGLPGMGTYTIQAVMMQDITVVQGVVIVFALCQLTVALLADLTYSWLNPKIRSA